MLLTLATLLLAWTPQPEEPVTLKWKLPKDGVLGFRTAVFESLDPKSAGRLQLDIAKLAAGEPLSEEARRLAMEIPDSYSLTTLLQNLGEGRLGVKMIVGEVNLPPTDSEVQERINEFLRKLQNSVQVRGEITPTGQLTSWWLESRQANLILLFTELPDRPVRVGDTWPLGISFVTMGHGFRASKAERVNRVQLVSLAPAGEDRVAVLEYVIAESVEGDFDLPMKKESVPTTMRMAFAGRGEFLVGAGRWRRFNGRISAKSTGVTVSDTEQAVGLLHLDKVPPELLKLK